MLLTVILAAVHLTTRTPETSGKLIIDGRTVDVSELKTSHVTGTVVNGKGEERQIDSQGVSLSELCGSAETVRVTAADEYSALVKGSELHNAYLILAEDGSLQLIVFGDENSKRDVKNVVRLDTE